MMHKYINNNNNAPDLVYVCTPVARSGIRCIIIVRCAASTDSIGGYIAPAGHLCAPRHLSRSTLREDRGEELGFLWGNSEACDGIAEVRFVQ